MKVVFGGCKVNGSVYTYVRNACVWIIRLCASAQLARLLFGIRSMVMLSLHFTPIWRHREQIGQSLAYLSQCWNLFPPTVIIDDIRDSKTPTKCVSTNLPTLGMNRCLHGDSANLKSFISSWQPYEFWFLRINEKWAKISVYKNKTNDWKWQIGKKSMSMLTNNRAPWIAANGPIKFSHRLAPNCWALFAGRAANCISAGVFNTFTPLRWFAASVNIA